MRRLVIALVVAATGTMATAQELRLPNKSGSIKFAVIGDTGTGDKHQLAVAQQIETYRKTFQFPFIIMVGDNLYGGSRTKDYQKKFEVPYKPLLDGGVKFYASLGNHDDPSERFYKPFNMNGERYYTFKPSLTANVRFFALDSNYMDDRQLQWFEKELAASGSDWKIAYFHHPLYSSGQTHGSDLDLRRALEPLFIQYNVSVVFQGHDHVYERLKPQNGIQYWVIGSGGRFRAGDLQKNSALTAKGYDADNAFLLAEISGDTMTFNAVSRTGQRVDSGVVTCRKTK